MKVLGFLRNNTPADLDAVAYYRVYRPLREVNRQGNGITARVVSNIEVVGMTDDDLGGQDVYVMSRMYHRDCDEFIAKIHETGGVLVLDADDDLTEAYRVVSGRGREFREVLGKVDYVTTSTQPLAALFGQYTQRPPVVLPNHIDSAWMQSLQARRFTDDFTLGFSGSPTHWGDWYLPSAPFLRITQDYAVTPVLHGDMPSYFKAVDWVDKVLQLDSVPFSLYPLMLRQFDAVLCAVAEHDPFNDGKSNVKALECMALGVVPICSRFQPYMDLADAGAPVVIIEETSRDGWYAAMQKVVTDKDFCAEIKARGPTWVYEHRDITTGYKQWEKAYRSFANG